jgi:IS5 family transposase
MAFRHEGAFRHRRRTKLIHAAVATPANIADSAVPELLHGKETRVWGDQAYHGQRAVIRRRAPRGSGLHQPPLSPPRPGRSGRSGRAGEEPH